MTLEQLLSTMRQRLKEGNTEEEVINQTFLAITDLDQQARFDLALKGIFLLLLRQS